MGNVAGLGGILNVIMTCLLVISLLNINSQCITKGMKKLLEKISNCCLGAYLVSYIFDDIFYPILNTVVPEMVLRLNYYVIVVPVVFSCSLILSAILNVVYRTMDSILEKQ